MDHSNRQQQAESVCDARSSPESDDNVQGAGNFIAAEDDYPLPYGAHHLTPCSFEDFVDVRLPLTGRYDWVDGLLVAHPMPDKGHDDAISYLMALFSVRKRKFGTAIKAVTNAMVQVPRGSMGSSSSSRPFRSQSSSSDSLDPGKDCLSPDITVGHPVTESISADLSPASKKISFPLGNIPLLVVEVTSTNRMNDLKDKHASYARAGILEYIIVDRDKPHKGKDARVLVGKLEDGEYKYECYKAGENFEHEYFGTISASRALTPSVTEDAEVFREDAKEEKERIESAEKKAESAEKKAESAEKKAEAAQEKAREEKRVRETAEKKAEVAQEKAEFAQEKARKEKRRKNKYKSIARSAGCDVSSSSSSSAPTSPQPKFKRRE